MRQKNDPESSNPKHLDPTKDSPKQKVLTPLNCLLLLNSYHS